jgi:hypothetical protein
MDPIPRNPKPVVEVRNRNDWTGGKTRRMPYRIHTPEKRPDNATVPNLYMGKK